MTDAEAMQIVLDAGWLPGQISAFIPAYFPTIQDMARNSQEPDFDAVEDEFNNVLA